MPAGNAKSRLNRRNPSLSAFCWFSDKDCQAFATANPVFPPGKSLFPLARLLQSTGIIAGQYTTVKTEIDNA